MNENSKPVSVHYSQLPASELDALAAKYDRVIDPSEARPLKAAERARESRARRKAGRPRVGAGAEKLRISMERTLLERVDAYAREHGMTRSQLISDAMRERVGRRD